MTRGTCLGDAAVVPGTCRTMQHFTGPWSPDAGTPIPCLHMEKAVTNPMAGAEGAPQAAPAEPAGALPEKQGWLKKATGWLDTKPGVILMAVVSMVMAVVSIVVRAVGGSRASTGTH